MVGRRVAVTFVERVELRAGMRALAAFEDSPAA
jgi:hypothetical protein